MTKEQIKELARRAYKAGFENSGEGYNADYIRTVQYHGKYDPANADCAMVIEKDFQRFWAENT